MFNLIFWVSAFFVLAGLIGMFSIKPIKNKTLEESKSLGKKMFIISLIILIADVSINFSNQNKTNSQKVLQTHNQVAIIPSMPTPTATQDQQIASLKQKINQRSKALNAPTQSKETQAPTATPTPSYITINSTSLIATYDQNKIAAEDKYTGKSVQTSGIADNISNDFLGKYYVMIKPSADYYGTNIQCYINDKKQILKINNGQSITIRGTMEKMTLGIILIKDCNVIN